MHIDNAYGVHPRPVLGIYVDWRGEAINGNHWYSWPFSQLTLGDRKNTAQNVGNGDVYELLVRLSLLRGANKGSRLVVIGHSFGAASHHITKGLLDQGLTPYRMPIMNIRATADVMADHNDIWNPMQGFLTQFVILSIYHPDQM